MKNVNLRLPDPLHERVKAAADRDDRSLNSEILWLLKIGLDVRDTTPRVMRDDRV